MDGSRFDELTKGMARGLSRRAMLRGLAGGLLGTTGLAAANTGARAKKGGTGGGGGSSCEEGLVPCRGQCMSTEQLAGDSRNCGACGNACSACQVCSGGVCVSNGDACCGIRCSGGTRCENGACVSTCTPRCQGKQCGDDGCGGFCGTCDTNQTCVNGRCCEPSCDGKCNGDSDSCGGTCPDTHPCCGVVCGPNEHCSEGSCVCATPCGGNDCGVDGCGNSCGTCGLDHFCNGGQCDLLLTTTPAPTTTTPLPATTTTPDPTSTTTDAPTCTPVGDPCLDGNECCSGDCNKDLCRCASDADCPTSTQACETLVCDTSNSFTCVPQALCNKDCPCGPCHACTGGTCALVSDDNACDGGICCGGSCRTDGQACSGCAGQVCDETKDILCCGGHFCVNNVCMTCDPGAPCASNQDCCQGVCAIANRVCVPCLTVDDCDTGAPPCHRSASCSASNQCSYEPYCDDFECACDPCYPCDPASQTCGSALPDTTPCTASNGDGICCSGQCQVGSATLCANAECVPVSSGPCINFPLPCCSGSACNQNTDTCVSCGSFGGSCGPGTPCCGGLVCGLNGTCVECNLPFECPGFGDSCVNVRCTFDGVCESEPFCDDVSCGCGPCEACDSSTCVPLCGPDQMCGPSGCCTPNNGPGTVSACTESSECCSGCCLGGGCVDFAYCEANLCSGVTCTSSDQCHEPGLCDPFTGICSDPVKADGAACDDGNACTQTDTCQAGVCAGANPVTCTASDDCHNPGTCNPATGFCSNPVKDDGAACDDGDGVCSSGQCLACLPGSERACYTGPGGTAGVSICRMGIETCLADGGGYGPCEGEVTPAVEVCNGVDDDCDGATDNSATCPPLANGVSECVSGECVLAACDTGYADCDGDPANGCETNVATSVSNCGACGRTCSQANGVATCSNGSCGIDCNTGFANCNAHPADGCETNLNTDINNCGACGNRCSLQNATEACVNGQCLVVACDAGWGDCENQPANGCETNLSTDVNNCGACGNRCSLQNATEACVNGQCQVVACDAGWGNCDELHGNGCEANLSTSPAHCGECGNDCRSWTGNENVACNGGVECCANPGPGWICCPYGETRPAVCSYQDCRCCGFLCSQTCCNTYYYSCCQ